MTDRGVTATIRGLDNNVTDLLLATIERRLIYIGEECVAEARSKEKENDWGDVTGNLRSSIGYVVLKDGETLQEGAPQVFSGSKGTGTRGPSNAHSLLSLLRSNFHRGLVLIVCAGMDYASNVEARGRNVLTSAELKAETLVSNLVNRLMR